MNNSIKQLITILLIGSMGPLSAASGRDQTIKPYTCCVGNITGSCTCIIPAAEVGDQVKFDTTGVPVKALGTISAEMSGTITIPLVDKKQIISFVPQGDTPFKGKEIKLLFASFDVNKLPADASESVKNNAIKMKKGMGDAVKTMVSSYRQLPGETLWTEFGTTGSPLADLGKADPINYTIMPNGQFIVRTQFLNKEGKIEPLTWNADLGKIG